ncbi:hypothetical protein BJY04DRAFT_222664 [Aspergillus karnatakaensis]|uniref:uncharacterized protein n=1 Tax=Aspergillus karnatakaensis TaxID=1810916 RepID=UPI003CCE190D
MAHLPPEILYSVVDCLDNTSDRISLLRVCRHWRAVLSREAYRCVHVEGSQIRSLVALVLDSPRLAGYIRQLSLYWCKFTPDGKDKDPLPSTVLDLVDRVFSTDERENVLADLVRGDGDAWISLLLISLPNLTDLTGRAWAIPSTWITRIVASAAFRDPPFDQRPVLQCLTSLRTESTDTHDYYAPYQFMPFFYLPAMRAVHLAALKEQKVLRREGGNDHPSLRTAKGTSPVASLTFETHCTARYGMRDILTACSNLKRFTYQHFIQVDWGSQYTEYRPWLFHPTLYTQRHSLEVLYLNHEGECGESDDDSDLEEDDYPAYNRWFGSLKDFERLAELCIRVNNLLNFHPKDQHKTVTLIDILPRSLKLLHLTGCGPEHCPLLIPNLHAYLSDRAHCPYLREVLIETWSSERYSFVPQPSLGTGTEIPSKVNTLVPVLQKADLAPIEAMCSSLGIHFMLYITNRWGEREPIRCREE